MEAGRELDALIAERIFHFTVVRDWPCWYDSGAREWRLANDGDKGASPQPIISLPPETPLVGAVLLAVPCYSTDIRAAWPIVEKLYLSIRRNIDGWTVSWVDGKGYPFTNYVHAGTAPLAICLAALEIIGG